ncbi:HtaA domain-containing protein [Glutamicibacter sp. MNS18]|uniref:HtaA domain-containing protein n=1 Tax=Glutamicibacter sp. MNS18 TaxID=2989817 RepID=UPI002235E33E|nr:HtaA domain-containing protein [Glutamicibacter sp. MNS18]MCW4465923.1 HtaA domain-containing protein [Glutamicibacter sp. MNS18]
MSVAKNGMSKVRKPLALAAAAGVAISMAAFAAPAQAAEQTVDDVTLSWGLNAETGAGAYANGCNFLSAGKAGNSGSSRAWTEDDGFHKGKEGNVSVVVAAADGTLKQQTWASRCDTGDGVTVSASNPAAPKSTNNFLLWENGSGTVDVAAKTASINWTGSFTAVFYGGLTYWSASNPTLDVKSDGTATLKATASGYGADQADASKWSPIEPQEITLANLTGVTVGADGFVKIPEYLGVLAPASVTNQVTTGATWGSFPSDFVEFQGLTGTQAYWFSSGGGADVRKPASELSIELVAEATEPEQPEEPENPEESDSKDLDVEVTVPETEGQPEQPGTFSWAIDGTSANLGTASQNAAGFVANGTLPKITVTDDREVTNGWQVTGKAANFTAGSNSFAASALGWTPAGQGNNGVLLGTTILPGSANGLSASAVMASATGKSSATLNTGIQLLAPADAPAGDYTSVLTITAIQK